MTKIYRPGGLGAMMDEYERSAGELTRLLQEISESDFIAEHLNETQGHRSAQSIMRHVLRAAYGYANDIRGALGIPRDALPQITLTDKNESVTALQEALHYTALALEDKWTMPDKNIEKITMPTPWGTTYTLEQMLEHAIVHILRHRRQIERILGK